MANLNKIKEAPSTSAKSTLTDHQLAEFAAWVEASRAQYQIPGMAVAIVQGNETIFAKGFGVKAITGTDPITPETLFHIGSTNKSVTAMLIASLVDDDYLAWDMPVIEIDSEFELSDPKATKSVTIRHLLSMSSGIPDEAEDDFDVDNATAADVFEAIAETPLFAMPGQEFSYSNLSVSAAGYLAVLAAGGEYGELYAGYAQLVQERIFDPIDMQTATLSVEKAWANPNHSKSHVMDDGKAVVAESYDFTGDPLAPSGAIKASAVDMALYLSTQLNRGVAPNGTQVVSEKNLVETWQPQIAEGDGSQASYAMGWEVETIDGVNVVSHEGSYDSFTSILVLIPEANIGMVVLSNLDDPDDFMQVMQAKFVAMVGR